MRRSVASIVWSGGSSAQPMDARSAWSEDIDCARLSLARVVVGQNIDLAALVLTPPALTSILRQITASKGSKGKGLMATAPWRRKMPPTPRASSRRPSPSLILSADELKAILTRKGAACDGLTFSDEDAEDLLESFDTNGDGVLQLTEFIELMLSFDDDGEET